MPRISVIIPVYNVEAYLAECLDSVLAQTLPDIEAICVNDGSTDGSRAVLARYAARDPRVVIVDKDNGGLSSARNAGIDAARAPYLCFLDSDDLLEPHACERIVQVMEDRGADVLTFGATCFPKGDYGTWYDDVLSPSDVTYNSFSIHILFLERSRPFAWRTACRTSLMRERHIRFDEGVRFGEDTVFHFAVYPRAGRTVLASDKLYDYRAAREGSLMDRLNKDEHALRLEHVRIVDAVLADWQGLGILDAYAARMLDWALEFVVVDTLLIPADKCADVARSLRAMLSAYWDEPTMRALAADEPSVAQVLNEVVLADEVPGGLRRTHLYLTFMRHLRGIRIASRDLLLHYLGR